ncbi:MAG: asparagine synthase (glutamine-hydrolyzing) [Deltaproteobacteria bacterium]|nr:asparagine synthase (glutamine-hydrolyzing) [Deltaproteobacteria bacterium]
MCGINLFLNKQGTPVAPSLIREANSRIRHRGPDDEQSYCWENIGLGFVRLSIVDLATGQQPFFSEDRSKVLLCNGEIYNYRQLREELAAKGHRFTSKSDCEVILHLYEEEPKTFVQRLEGMFAFVLLDEQRKQILLARDRTGIKPLFYTNQADTFACSSEIRGIIPALATTPKLNSRAIKDAFTFGYIPGEQTAFTDIYHVPPAHLMTYCQTTNLFSGEEYWAPEFVPATEKKKIGMGTYTNQLNSLLSKAVDTHTIGDVSMSAYLSGGIDSTIVTGLLRQGYAKTNDLQTFSIKFADRNFDESEVFEQTSKIFGLPAKVVTMKKATADDFLAAVQVIEQPQFTPLDIPMQQLAAMVRENERKVVLVGEGSDELFGGYVSFVLNQARRAIFMPFIEPMRPLLLEKVTEYFLGRGEFSTRVAHTLLTQTDEVIAKFGTYPAWYPWWAIANQARKGLFKDKDYDSLAADSAMLQVIDNINGHFVGLSEYDKSLYIELKTRLPNYILSRADRNSMHSSVELRLPFLDNEVLDYSLTIPEGYKMFALKEKYVLRKAMANVLPKHIVNRRKFGYDSPVKWIWENQTERSRYLLSDEALKKTDVFAVDEVQAIHKSIKDKAFPEQSQDYQEKAGQLSGVLAVQALALLN